ncbi:MAG TPA: hypothetical protein VJ957_04180 [Longimicrobiales bacterium]|nr:hypothetical protein [Longimicrobiales bacterium]
MRSTMMVLAAMAMVGTTACASAGRTAMQQPGPKSNAAVPLTVRNDNGHDVNVYAMVNGTYRQVMEVPAMETRKLDLPRAADTANGLQLKVETEGSDQTYSTNAILVAPGDGIDLTVAKSVTKSSWAVD